MPKIIHLRNKCIGCNSCVEHASSFWKINPEDGKSDLKAAKEKNKNGIFVLEISEVDREKNELAARDCPVNIIQVTK